MQYTCWLLQEPSQMLSSISPSQILGYGPKARVFRSDPRSTRRTTRHGMPSAARLYPSATQGSVLVCVTERQDSRLAARAANRSRARGGNKSSRPPLHRTLSPQPTLETRKPNRPPMVVSNLSRGRDSGRNRCGILFRSDSIMPSGRLGLE